VKDDENILVKKHANDFKWFMMQMDQKTKSLVLDSPDMVPEGEVKINFSLLNKTPGTCNFAIFVEDVTRFHSLPIAAATTVTYTVPAETLIQSPTIFIHQKTRIHEPSFKKTGASEKVENVPYLFVKKVEYQYPRQAIVREAPLVFHHQVWPATMEAVSLRGQENLTGPLSAWVIQDGDVLLRLEAEQLPEGKSLALPPEWERVEIHDANHIPEIFRAHADYPSTLHRVEQGYDYIIIAYRTMMEEAKKLAERRAEDGFSVLLTDIQDIYDEFNYGYPNYDALVRFLRYAQSEWRGLSPEFVVLIGDSSWDHRDRENMGCVDQIPAYAPLNNPQRFAEDDFYTQLWGTADDYFADVIIGRISVREPHELAQYLTKMELYEDDLPVGPWKARNFLVADNTFERYSYTAVETSIPSRMVTDQVHQVDYPHFTNSFFYNMFKDNPDPTTREYLNKKYCPECTEEIIDGFNEGALFVQYIGHGGNQIWSHERIFYGTNRTYSDVLRFEPTRKFPFVMNWSCLTGYLNFNIPPFNVCLAEELLRYPDRGGIAIWAPSGGGSTEYHMVLLHLNVRNMLNRHLVRFGESITQAKIEFLSRNRSPDITKQYVLFGDPALSLSLPKDELKVEVEPSTFLPETQQKFTVQSHVPSFKEGKAITYVTANGKTVYKSPVFAFTGSRIVHSATVSLEAGEYSNASVGIYAWNGRDNVDAWGGTTIPAYEPRLVAKNGKALVSEGKAFVIFDLFNDSPFAAEKVTCHLLIGGASHTVEAASVPANATTTLRWEGAVAQNAVMAFVTVHGNEDYTLSGREEDRELAIPLRAINKPTVIPMIHKMTATALELIEHDTEQLRIPMFNPTGKLVEAAFQLDGPGSATTEYNLKIPADREISARFSVTFPAAGDYTYVLHTSVADASYTTKIPLSIKRQPDLVFLQEDMRIEPEAPVLGRTVYFYGRIANVGEGPAKNIAVQAFDGPPKQGKKLSNFDGSTNVKIPLLPPGEDTPFEITWDPESYEGLGEHEIHLVVDKYNRVPESNEDNNTLIKKVVLHNLPDLKVDPTGDHQLTLRGETVPIYEWGRPLHVTGRMRNQGESDAEYARLTMVHNKTEYHTVFDRIRAGGANETRFDVPLVSAKNSLIIYADKYDLVGETDDTGNNVSFNERLYVKLKMPEAKKREGRRVYEVKTETHFTAGQSEFLHFDETKEALVMHPDLNEVNVRILPQYVEDKDSFVTVQTRFQWRWNPKFNRFVAPMEKLGVLEARVPSPQGRYEVFL
ncbi:hypothetical protein GF373_14665, partial [bacterium]|nr:hypothetical protein [bacterium]